MSQLLRDKNDLALTTTLGCLNADSATVNVRGGQFKHFPLFKELGGTKDLRKSTAELLAKMEKKMREEEAAKVEKEKTQK